MLSSRIRGAYAVIALTFLGCAGVPAQEASAPPGITRDFLTITTDGTEISGESFLGHVTIVDFWAVF